MPVHSVIKYMKRYRLVLLGALFTAIQLATFAQKRGNAFRPYSTVGLGVGTSSYVGEMAGYSTPFATVFKMMRWNVGGTYTRQVSPHFAARVGFTWARISGDDYTFNLNQPDIRFLRNLHFRNDIKEFSLIGMYFLRADGRSSDRRAQFNPYIFAGIAAFSHNPVARVPEKLREIYGNKWIALQPLGTEGQGQPGYANPYSLFGVAIPFGAGFRYKINDRMNIGAELGFRFTNTDFLDDVSGLYADPNVLSSVLAKAMSNRSQEVVAARKLEGDRTDAVRQYLVSQKLFPNDSRLNPLSNPIEGQTTGDPRGSSGRNDTYLLGTITFSYVLRGRSNLSCPVIR